MPRYSQDKLAAKAPVPRQAFTIQEFCDSFGISTAFYYKLKKQGQAPREMKIGARTLISVEAAADWRIAREGAAVD
jgi:predicted DNA-binding transcriptional regulator AlpA